MTVSNQTNRTSAVGSGSGGQEVTIPFPYSATSDLSVISRVTATGVETSLVETTNYTVTAASESGGTLTTVTAVAVTAEIHIIRDTPNTQSLDLVTGGNFNAENIENALDKNTTLIIENKDSLGRTLTFPDTDPSTSFADMPNSVDRASLVLSFDTLGKPTVSSAVPTGSVSFSALGTSIAETANEASFKSLVNLEIGTDVLAQQTIGISDDNLIEVDGTPADNEYAKFTASGLEGQDFAEMRTDLDINKTSEILCYEGDVLTYENEVLTYTE